MNGNAQITATHLGYEDHGLLTCMLTLDGEGFGGYRLDGPGNQPTKYAGWWIARLLETVGVQKWEDLKGKYVRVDGEEFGDIHGIGHITKDKWFHPKLEVEKLDRESNDGNG